MMIPARACTCRLNRWSTNFRIGLMSRKRMPYIDALEAGADLAPRGAAGAGPVAAVGDAEPHRVGSRLLRKGGQVLGLAADQRVPHRQRHAVLEADVRAHRVEQPVDPRCP